MYLNHIASYLPEKVVTNEHFNKLNNLSKEWIVERTGIKQRRKAAPTENTHTMGIAAVEAGKGLLPFPIAEIDLIVGATYTPHDTIYTLGHAIQNHLNVSDIPVVTISSACSSLLNAIEIVEGYFATGKANKALVVVSEHNTAYSNDEDTIAGHLWGDGAAALWFSKNRIKSNDLEVKDIITAGAGNVGKANEAVVLKPIDGGFSMPYGRDVFINACEYMSKVTQNLLDKNNCPIEEVDYFIPHQANLRITKNVAKTLNLPSEKLISNVEYLGNTGCAGCAIGIAENIGKFKPKDNIVIAVFGGGYSYGAMLLQMS